MTRSRGPLIVTLAIASSPILMGMHCPRRCPDEGPRYSTRINGPLRSGVELRRLVHWGGGGGVVSQELRVAAVVGPLRLENCDGLKTTWSVTVDAAPQVVDIPAEIDCLRLVPALEGLELVPASRALDSMSLTAELVTILEHAVIGARGSGVHGDECYHGVTWTNPSSLSVGPTVATDWDAG